jgi:type II secretory pathway predicted ATPase ExeA
MMEAYYNLKKLPFPKNIPPHELYITEAVAELHQRLSYIKEKRGIMLITGAPGTGKSAQLRSFVAKLSENLYKYFYIPLSKTQLFSSIQKNIREYVENAKKIPVIIFDEAHLLINENFYELQIITNFHMDSIDPAVFILSGQPHLRDRLLRPIHQSFNQRICLKFHLCPLTRDETKAYIEHQLHVAGASEDIFNQNAISALYQVSTGVPRVINNLATKALTIGALDKKDCLTEEEIYRASKEL